MKKIFIPLLIIAVINCIVLLSLLPSIMVGLDPERFRSPLGETNKAIKENMLNLTPINTSMDTVITLIEGEAEWNLIRVSNQRGVIMGEASISGTDPSIIVGEQFIMAYVGSYQTFIPAIRFGNHVVFRILANARIYVYWAFDEKSELIDLFVLGQTK